MDLDTTIHYRAERIDFDVRTRRTLLTGKAKIEYEDMTLEAHRIEVDWDHNLMTATPGRDTVWADSARGLIDSVRIFEPPTFTQGNQTMTGDLMRVNIKTKQGYLVGGRTRYEEGYYYGHDIQKVTDKILYIRNGSFTSCDLPEPHYSFTGSEMEMIYKDKVVGKPVVLRFGKVPVFALPFGVFSTKPGRHSGLIVPTYGDNSTQGRHLRNLGYYWAASDYFDARATLDFYEKLGILMRGDLTYRKRYTMNGGVSGSMVNQSVAGGGRKRRWDLRVKHNQDINPYTRLRMDGTFVSDGSYYNDVSNNADRRVDQKVRSNATLTRTWPGSRSSFSLNLSHEQNLLTGENAQTLPSMSFRLGAAPLFPGSSQRKKREKNVIYEPPRPPEERGEVEEEDRWYNSLTMSYSNRLMNRRSEERVGGSYSDPTSGTLAEEYRSGITHSVGFNAPQKALRYINLTPSLSYREDWFNERRRYFADSSGAVHDEQERGFFQRRTFSSSLSANTKVYGYFNLNLGSLRTIRHVVSPQISFTYRPDFSLPAWGLYQEVKLPGGDIVRRDRYAGSIFGGSPKGKQMRIGMSLGNLFQMKRVTMDEEGEEKELKTDLFTYNLNTSYNFAADSLRFAPLTASFRAEPIRRGSKLGWLERLSLDVATTHSFYQWDPEAGRTVDRFYWEQPGHEANLLRLTNFSTTSSFTLSGASPFAERRAAEAEADTIESELEGVPEVRRDLGARFADPSQQPTGRRDTPWDLTGRLRYNLRMQDPMNPVETITVNGNINVRLTRKWRFTYSTGFDLKTRDVISSSLRIHRDLHCWEGTFTWNPRGIGQGFYLRIGIKASQLKDVKLEQRRGRGTLSQVF